MKLSDVVIAFVLAMVALFFLVYAAHAHQDGAQQYDLSCCSQMDCAPVLKMVPGEDGDIMTSKVGTALVNLKELADWQKKTSVDGRWHVCMIKNDEAETVRTGFTHHTLCVYIPQLY